MAFKLPFWTDILLADIMPGPIDLSNCPSLEAIRLPVLHDNPGFFASLILPSISSSGLSTTVLYVKKMGNGRIYSGDSETLEGNLNRLAKRFKATHGRNMEVKVDISECKKVFSDQIANDSLMLDLGKEADMEICREIGDVRRYLPELRSSINLVRG